MIRIGEGKIRGSMSWPLANETDGTRAVGSGATGRNSCPHTHCPSTHPTHCETIAYALSQSTAGDTLLLDGGVYTENLTIDKGIRIVQDPDSS